jgi:AcrR family transcriptional regulator
VSPGSTRGRATQPRSERAIGEIAAAARTSFVTEGYAGATIDGIAARAGRTKGAVYHHFADKHALFRATFIEEQRTLADEVVAAATHPDPVESLARGLSAYLGLIGSGRERAQLTLVEAPQVLGWTEWRSCDGGPFRALLASSVAAIADSGRLRCPIDVDILAEFVLGAVTESALRIVDADDPKTVAARHARAIRLLVADLTTDA